MVARSSVLTGFGLVVEGLGPRIGTLVVEDIGVGIALVADVSDRLIGSARGPDGAGHRTLHRAGGESLCVPDDCTNLENVVGKLDEQIGVLPRDRNGKQPVFSFCEILDQCLTDDSRDIGDQCYFGARPLFT